MDEDTEGSSGVIVCNPGVIITYDPLSISGLSQHMLEITLSQLWLGHLSVQVFDTTQGTNTGQLNVCRARLGRSERM